jgi:c-di-GMP-related signal transduction protein
MKKTLIVLGVVAIVGAGIYFYRKGKSTSKVMATSSDFDEVFKKANDSGSDWFQGSSAERIKQIRDTYIKNVTQQEHKILVSTISKKPESSWSANEKIVVSDVMNKLSKGLKKS